MKKNLTRFVYGFMLLIATSCGKNGTTPDPAPAPEPEPEPTQLDRVEAQATYTAMMTDTLLEG